MEIYYAALSEVWWNEWNLQKQVEQSDYHWFNATPPKFSLPFFFGGLSTTVQPHCNFQNLHEFSQPFGNSWHICVQILFVPHGFVAFVLPPLAPQFAAQAWHKLFASQIANVLTARHPRMALIVEACFYIPPWAAVFRRRPSSATTAVAVSYCNGALSQGGGFAAKVWRAWLDMGVALGKNPRMQWPCTLACRMTDLEGGWIPHASWCKISPRVEPGFGAAGNAAWQQAPPSWFTEPDP